MLLLLLMELKAKEYSEGQSTGRIVDMSFDLSNIVQMNNKITCHIKEITPPVNNNDTQSEDKDHSQSGDKDDTQSGDNDDSQSGNKDDIQSGDKDNNQSGNKDDTQSGSESNKEEDSGKIIQITGYLLMFILFVF